jgi:hypothetical protein
MPLAFHCISKVPEEEDWLDPKSTQQIRGEVETLPVHLYKTAYLAVIVEVGQDVFSASNFTIVGLNWANDITRPEATAPEAVYPEPTISPEPI